MISKKQLIANRDNAKKSTGPRDTSKTRFNAVKHGLRAKSRAEFDELAGAINAQKLTTQTVY